MNEALDSASSGPGLSAGRGHYVVFFGKTLYSHGASLHPGVQMGASNLSGKPAKCWAGVNLQCTSIPSRGKMQYF